MPKKKKILFIYDHPKPDWWLDGLSAALDLLEEEYVIDRCNLRNQKPSNLEYYDFILGWGAFHSKVDQVMQQITEPVKKGLCIAGNSFPPDGMNKYDVLFHETKWYRNNSEIRRHRNIVHAFGINSDVFSPPNIPTPVVWDYIGVGALAAWKRWDKMTAKSGIKLVIGEMQMDNGAESMSIANTLLYQGVMVSPMVSPVELANLYYYARTLYMPADINGGGERAVWEAVMSGLSVEIEPDNPKLKELLNSEPKDHHWYAAQLKKGIESCL